MVKLNWYIQTLRSSFLLVKFKYIYNKIYYYFSPVHCGITLSLTHTRTRAYGKITMKYQLEKSNPKKEEKLFSVRTKIVRRNYGNGKNKNMSCIDCSISQTSYWHFLYGCHTGQHSECGLSHKMEKGSSFMWPCQSQKRAPGRGVMPCSAPKQLGSAKIEIPL